MDSVHAAILKVSGAMQRSSEVMKEVNDLVKLPELRKTMVEMSKGGRCRHHGWATRRVRVLKLNLYITLQNL